MSTFSRTGPWHVIDSNCGLQCTNPPGRDEVHLSGLDNGTIDVVRLSGLQGSFTGNTATYCGFDGTLEEITSESPKKLKFIAKDGPISPAYWTAQDIPPSP